jgi:hopanoid biosynthesis associated RND transporter like protein HpnN
VEGFCYPLDGVPNLNEILANALVGWVRAIARRPRTVVVATGLLTLALLGYTATHLRINSDNVRLIGENLPARKNHEAFAALFPNLENALLIVVDAETPELTREATEELTSRLGARSDLFTEVYLPGSGDFFERNGLLYRTVDELYEFSDQMARAQPLLAELERNPSIANLASLVQRGLDFAGEQPDDIAQWIAVLDQVGKATVEVYREYPLAISWEELIVQGSSLEQQAGRVIIAHPVLDFENVFAAASSLDFIHQVAGELGYTTEHGVTVRITGNPALNYEEMVGIAWDVGGAGVFCFALVIGVLIFALRSWKLVTAAVIALLTGLVWTAAFAALSIGHLNLVSVTFAVLFIGLGVAFGIHLGMCYADLLRMGFENHEAQQSAVRSVGTSLVLCTVTTAVGFFVFIPTDYRGVAELGLIAGTGMFIILFQTLTIIPALLSSWLAPDPDARPVGALRFQGRWWSRLDRHGVFVRRSAALAGLGALLLLPSVRFNANIIHMRDPSTESVQAFNDLLDQGGFASPWFINAVADDLESAQQLGARLSEFETVEQSITIADYVPADQEEKHAILTDIRYFFPPLIGSAKSKAAQPIEEQVSALRDLHAFLGRPGAVRGDSPLHESMRLLRTELADFLARVDRDGNAAGALASLESILLSGFPAQMARLRIALEPDVITLKDLPAPLVARMVTRDGRARIQIYPRESLIDEMAFSRFVADVQTVAPQAAGVPVNLVEFARATKSSFQQALLSAILAITVLLWLLWRRVSDVLLALAPLLLSSTLTCAALVLLDIPFNFANVIVIPLLLGVGVDSGIHLVHRANHLAKTDDSLLTTTTARAVLFSALTTAVSFGTLALSSHRGMASLGMVLTIGMLLSTICNLVVLPELIEWRSIRSRKRVLEGSVQPSH